MRNTFTITIQGNQGIEPKASFVVSGSKARRIIEILDHIDSEFIINLQGDEPLVNPVDLINLYEKIK